ncbi:hypothetical protein F4553_007150 [Allocatelliglobosispora scoriae]|uniref:Copper type II ascorbate-dependent monooxygenase C-terminal domain-containing protein n=1 Tax=Allocatelliglobosispora scoriae TaxID=643052 RepID=A0A841C1H6_9ACTN|nr:monooxygenase [Allocatelliglobosispora scoriae]MBB5873716.1 hypothetical protein [Allocatelliglobosispora scoriae]
MRLLGLITALAAATSLAACAANTPVPVAATAADPHASHRVYSAAPPAPLRQGERFVELSMERPFTPQPPNGGTDEYRCFLVDPELTDAAFITGSQFLPQNADIVHHAIFFRVQPGDVAQARELDAEEDGDGWTCFGGTGIGSGGTFGQLNSGASWIAAWAPGGHETLMSAKVGYRMEAGSQLVMQVHYSTVALGGAKPAPDRSGIRLRLAPGTAALAPLQTTLLPGAVELPCTSSESGPLCDRENAVLDVWHRFGTQAGSTVAGLNLLCNGGKTPVPGPVQECDHRVREAGLVYAAAGHMHLLGRSIKVELNPGTPKAKVLLDVPVYDFDNQGARPLLTPVRIAKGDNLRVTCTHDASLRSQLPSLKRLEPRYVVWGEGTSDEMCLGILTWTRP